MAESDEKLGNINEKQVGKCSRIISLGVIGAVVFGIGLVFWCFMSKPLDITKYEFVALDKPLMVELNAIVQLELPTEDGAEVRIPIPKEVIITKSAELAVDYEQIQHFLARETAQHTQYLSVVSIMIALFGIFGSVVAIGMGVTLSLKERGIDAQIQHYEQAIKQGREAAEKQLKNIEKEKSQALEIMQEQFDRYVLESIKPTLVHSELIDHLSETDKEKWETLKEEVKSRSEFGYSLLDDNENKLDRAYRALLKILKVHNSDTAKKGDSSDFSFLLSLGFTGEWILS